MKQDCVEDFLSLKNPTGRWSALGPYYAMFPRKFTVEVIQEFTTAGDAVLDPFAGRASNIFAAASIGRYACGVEINPVGWLYGHVKLQPAKELNVLRRAEEIASVANSCPGDKIKKLPPFFQYCYCDEVLRYLITAREELRWKTSIVDGTLMALMLVDLHGRRGSSLSNQMRQSKSMAPDYSVRWWRERGMSPPSINPLSFLTKKIRWRYAKGITKFRDRAVVFSGDSTNIIPALAWRKNRVSRRQFDLLFTSPPYYKLTNYHYDQWLRLWMLGGSAYPLWYPGTSTNKFENKLNYSNLLASVFSASTSLLKEQACIYVRTDARKFTYETTLKILRDVFPNKSIQERRSPVSKYTQTALFGDKTLKPGEVDLILSPR
ncbi:site-specific DNA-methyltransferase [bacterium]|nr:site-specific DNA-methyltransferase [bacterium]